ncbi:hypothetical protein N7540_000755 [Penicillium herquei]|nr:hypothetical protein N7540_000755 [Penicillium herquei]
MAGYLEVNNDILDASGCSDQEAVEWFSVKYGRKHEEKFGPWDRRVSKRLGSGKDMPVDMRDVLSWKRNIQCLNLAQVEYLPVLSIPGYLHM